MSLRVRLLIAALLLPLPAAAADQTVAVGPAFVFSPSAVSVSPGDTVTWVWQEGPHSTTSDAASGLEVWDSGILGAGANFAHTFQTPGDHPYYCIVHSFPGGTMMNGVVRVVAVTATPTPPGPTPTPTAPRPTAVPQEPAPIPALSGVGSLLLGILLAGAAMLVLSLARPR
jgi:plastocyanin